MTAQQMQTPKLFNRVVLQQDDPQQNIQAGMTGVLMELGADQTWGIVELDDDAITLSGRYTASVALEILTVMTEVYDQAI